MMIEGVAALISNAVTGLALRAESLNRLEKKTE